MINKKNLNEQIYEALRQDIIDQKIKFGQKLVNRDLREHYGVSSTPVRDAINRLYQDGLLEDISNVGARVIDFDYNFAIEINEIISMLSIEAVGLSAKKARMDEIVPVLNECIRQQLAHIDTPDYFIYDRNFHQTFFDFCYNERYKQIYIQQQTLWEILFRFFYQDKESTKSDAIYQHQQILDAYQHGDIRLAQEYLERHCQDAAQVFIKVLPECK